MEVGKEEGRKEEKMHLVERKISWRQSEECRRGGKTST